MNESTRVLEAVDRGKGGASAELLPLVYDELPRLAAARIAQDAAGYTFQPTALGIRHSCGWWPMATGPGITGRIFRCGCVVCNTRRVKLLPCSSYPYQKIFGQVLSALGSGLEAVSAVAGTPRQNNSGKRDCGCALKKISIF